MPCELKTFWIIHIDGLTQLARHQLSRSRNSVIFTRVDTQDYTSYINLLLQSLSKSKGQHRWINVAPKGEWGHLTLHKMEYYFISLQWWKAGTRQIMDRNSIFRLWPVNSIPIRDMTLFTSKVCVSWKFKMGRRIKFDSKNDIFNPIESTAKISQRFCLGLGSYHCDMWRP